VGEPARGAWGCVGYGVWVDARAIVDGSSSRIWAGPALGGDERRFGALGGDDERIRAARVRAIRTGRVMPWNGSVQRGGCAGRIRAVRGARVSALERIRAARVRYRGARSRAPPPPTRMSTDVQDDAERRAPGCESGEAPDCVESPSGAAAPDRRVLRRTFLAGRGSIPATTSRDSTHAASVAGAPFSAQLGPGGNALILTSSTRSADSNQRNGVPPKNARSDTTKPDVLHTLDQHR
jgi:hypothetical protein